MIVGALLGATVAYRWLAPSATPPQTSIKVERFLMGTRWIIEVVPDDRTNVETARQLVDAAFDEVARVESVMSEWMPESPISAINAAAGREAVEVPGELADIIRRSLQISERSRGAFDITWRGLGRLWPVQDENFSPPSDAEIQAALHRVGYRKVQVEGNRVHLIEAGMAIGLGGIAKGYGVDRAADVLRAGGCANFFIDGGGDVLVSGSKHGKPWRVGIQHPRKARGELLAVVEADSGAVVSSGDYERFREVDGVRYHHIIDLRTGRPARKCQAVTIIAPSAERADALATAVFVLGPEEGLELIRQEPGADALVVDHAGRIWTTEGFTRRAEILR